MLRNAARVMGVVRAIGAYAAQARAAHFMV